MVQVIQLWCFFLLDHLDTPLVCRLLLSHFFELVATCVNVVALVHQKAKLGWLTVVAGGLWASYLVWWRKFFGVFSYTVHWELIVIVACHDLLRSLCGSRAFLVKNACIKVEFLFLRLLVRLLLLELLILTLIRQCWSLIKETIALILHVACVCIVLRTLWHLVCKLVL